MSVEVLSGRGLDNAGFLRHTNGTAGRSAIRKHRTYENTAESIKINNNIKLVQQR